MARLTYVITCTNVRPDALEAVRARIGARVYEKAKKPVALDKAFEASERFTEPTLSERVEAAADLLDNAQSVCDDLASQMGDWYDNLPESFQSGDKGDSLNEAKDALDELTNALSEPDQELRQMAVRLEQSLPAGDDSKRPKVIDLKLTLSPWHMDDVGMTTNIKGLQKALKGIDVSIRKDDGCGSRGDQLADAQSDAEKAVEILQGVLAEMKSDHPTLLEDEIETLQEIIDELDGQDFGSVEFPGMY